MPLLKVPHVKQKGPTHCGVACLEMVYRYFDIKNTTQDTIWEKRKTTRPDGSNPYITTQNMAIDLADHGFQVLIGQIYLDPKKSLSGLKKILAEGNPIIACKQWPGDPLYGHFVVIIGIEKNTIAYRDPENEKEATRKSVKDFFNEWKATGEEVIGGEFIVMAKHKKEFPIQSLELTSFNAPNLESFRIKSLKFES